MELGALICAPRNPRCDICPVKKLCVARRENCVEQLPNLGKRAAATARHFIAFVIEKNGRFLVRQRPAGVVNAHLWEFPGTEAAAGGTPTAAIVARAAKQLGLEPDDARPLCTLKHSITRYRITLEAFRVQLGKRDSPAPEPSNPRCRGTRHSEIGVWRTSAQLQSLAFTSAHRKVLRALIIASGK
jgi:A/G-specific adenine glycosylase